MEPIPFKVTEKENASFHVQINEGRHQYDKMHYHPEFQLSLILEGSGSCVIGNNRERFQPGDIFFIGSNVPHVFKNDEEYYQNSSTAKSHFISLFFKEDSFGKSLFQLPEMTQIKAFLEESAKGVKLGASLASSVQASIQELIKMNGASRIIQLIALLNQIALSPDKQFLTAVAPESSTDTVLYPRLSRIMRYIAENFDRPISLEEVAKEAHLSKYSFSRFFKQYTNKSFIHYLNEVRISKACKLLMRSNYSISQIGFQSGFNNLSNFYRQFKKVMRCTPSEYRELQNDLF